MKQEITVLGADDIESLEYTFEKADEVFLTLDRVLEFTELVINKYHDTFRLCEAA